MSALPLLEVSSLVKQYPATTAVDGVSFHVPEGTCFGLLGPNGAGKTTTVEIMEGILPPTSGEVRYRGERLGRRFREEAGILFQKTALQDFLTVRQCVALFRGLYAHGLDVEEVIRICAPSVIAASTLGSSNGSGMTARKWKSTGSTIASATWWNSKLLVSRPVSSGPSLT